MTDNPRLPIHAAHGTELTAGSWQTEAPLRMLMNNLDPENAERPEDLVVYGGTGKAARSWEAYDALVRTFFEVHDPTQGMRQGNDVGTQYRSAIYTTTPEQEQVAKELTEVYATELERRGLGPVTTEIAPAPAYYYAEDVHQQYLHKVPNGYRCHSATGVPVPAIA